MFYVYVYLDRRKPGQYNYGKYLFEYEPFYVGKGKGNRFYHHISRMAEKQYNPHKNNKINKIKEVTGLDPVIIKYKDNLSSSKAFIIEEEMIRTIGRYDLKTGPLVNYTDGGEGGSNVSEEIKQKLRNWERTKEYKDRISKTLKGRKRTKESIEKSREPCRLSAMGNTNGAKDFIVVTPRNEVIRIRNLKAFCKEKGLTYNLMRAVVDGRRNHHKGWKVSNILTENEIIRMKGVVIKRNTAGFQLVDNDGKTYITHNLKEFCESRGLQRSNMMNVTNKNKKYKGWICVRLHTLP